MTNLLRQQNLQCSSWPARTIVAFFARSKRFSNISFSSTRILFAFFKVCNTMNLEKMHTVIQKSNCEWATCQRSPSVWTFSDPHKELRTQNSELRQKLARFHKKPDSGFFANFIWMCFAQIFVNWKPEDNPLTTDFFGTQGVPQGGARQILGFKNILVFWCFVPTTEEDSASSGVSTWSSPYPRTYPRSPNIKKKYLPQTQSRIYIHTYIHNFVENLG